MNQQTPASSKNIPCGRIDYVNITDKFFFHHSVGMKTVNTFLNSTSTLICAGLFF